MLTLISAERSNTNVVKTKKHPVDFVKPDIKQFKKRYNDCVDKLNK